MYINISYQYIFNTSFVPPRGFFAPDTWISEDHANRRMHMSGVSLVKKPSKIFMEVIKYDVLYCVPIPNDKTIPAKLLTLPLE